MAKFAQILLLVLSLVSESTQQIGFGCPPEWELHGDQCYRFYFDKPRMYQEAASACWVQGSALVSVNNMAEHLFISKYLNQHGRKSAGIWYTSGETAAGSGSVKWNGDGTYSNDTTSMYWNSPADYALEYRHVVYKYSEARREFGWTKVLATTPLYYICEIPKTETARIIQQHRDFGYGSNETTAAFYERGPHFVVQPGNTIVVGSVRPIALDCVAVGNPQPRFTWYEMNATYSNPTLHHMSTYQEITSSMDSRYTFTNGRLTISHPRETTDAGTYQCKAENQFGSILSEPMALTFGYLNEFSPNQRGFVEGLLNKGTYINCKPPSFKPAVRYQWFKDPDINNTESNVYTKTLIASNFIRPDMNTYTFISQNGNLYFSEIQYQDRGQYYCVVTLAAPVGTTLSTKQPPSSASRAIELRVRGNPSSEYGPIIHPDFIAVFPKPPMVGHDVTLECFAYGKMPLRYSWSRADKPFPKGTRFGFDNRVMTIPNANLEDSGNYTCEVVKITGKEAVDYRSIILTLEAKPVFTFPLRNMHADIGSSLTWRCEAEAVPKAVYAWYKDSKLLKNIPGQLEIHENVLHILQLSKPRDDGMYQCAASNAHGTSITSAQLRVLAIKPNFYKNPLFEKTVAAQGGNITIPCRPEAAPTPDITWTRNGQQIGLDGRYSVSIDGTLHVTQVNFVDQGQYVCKANNVYGESQSATSVLVYGGVRFSTFPSDTVVEINRTTFIYCQATYDYSQYDLAYVWKFNGRLIDHDNDPFYRPAVRDGIDGLYVVNAQYYHTGMYDCTAQTVFTSLTHSAQLEVQGPPGEPAGVYVESNSITGTSLRLMWTWSSLEDHGFPVNYFVVEAHTEYNSSWVVIAEDIPATYTVVPGSQEKRFFIVKDLLPNNGYTFRVTAKNDKGVGTPSIPRGVYRIPAAAPTRAPSNVGGGGGSVGILTMTWQPLSRSEEGGKGFGYKVYWRLANQSNTQWREEEVGNVSRYAYTVGQDNFYLLYEVMVQAYNVEEGTGEKRYGPTSPIGYAYSAEGMPIHRPTNVRYQNINGTAILVTWDPVPNTRAAMRGKVLGYEIIWDVRGGDNKTRFSFVYCSDCNSGYVIGLPPGGYFWIRVVVFNTAGRGVPSEKYLATTYENPPGRYPLYVTVHPFGPHSARVTWRGVNVILGESTLLGYKLIWWAVGDDIRMANQTTVGRTTEAFIHGLQFDTIYKLRMMAFNRGGDGKKSPTVYFTVEKGGFINVNQASFDPATSQLLLASAPKLVLQNFFLLLVIFIIHIIFK